ncbi:MAG: alkaline phosphatase D family protein [Acidimicrobiia bacterium]|nr:alkaline phosphatase D family protein [Acidimicrobiia bacterium]
MSDRDHLAGSGPAGRPPASVEVLDDVDVNRLMVFVPAIMSVGLFFSLVVLVRDLIRWTGGRSRDRRTAIEAAAVVNQLLDEGEPEAETMGILSRPAYLVSALVLVGGAAYIAIGSTANFLRDGGYVSDIGWLLALSLGLAVMLGFLGAVALAVFWSWPRPASWTLGALRAAPLTVNPTRPGAGPSWSLGAATLLAGLATGVVTLLVGSGRSIAAEIDEPISQWIVEASWIDRLTIIDLYGRTTISIVFVMVIGLSAFRCRVMALVYPVALVASLLATAFLRELVERPRPTVYDDFDSFPSGHMVQAVFIAGLVPLALGVLLLDRRVATLSRAVLAIAVVATGLYRVHQQNHWPLDSLAGVTLGLTVVLGVNWAMEQRSWHRQCSSCPWSDNPGHIPWQRRIFALPPPAAERLGWAGALLALAAAAILAVMTVTVGLPTDPEGYGFGSVISRPVQLGLASLMAIAGGVAFRWRASGAFLMAVAACGLGLFASVQYRPEAAISLAALLLIPAVVTWLAWQPTETLASIIALAVVTTTALSGTAFGATRIYDHYFGPTHPTSAAPDRSDIDGRWFWLGNVDPHSATVVAGGNDPDETVELVWWTDERTATIEARADRLGLARFVIDDLDPGEDVSYRVDERDDAGDDDNDDEPGRRADGTLTTPLEGPQDLIVVAGSCARSGSNGAVFDAIVAEEPDLYLALGDLHYANLESTSPADHVAQYGRALGQPGQAALFGSVPSAYVWDDHDYGPNNGDHFSPSRLAVSEAYRRAVPHYGASPDPDTPIAQAFTVGRVRFVLSDTRSERTAETMLGEDQLAWLIDELISASRTHALVVWANPTPWISAGGPDDWSGYASERTTIADALADAGVDDVIMVSGDAHMVAIDDGTNSGYATDGTPGFPVLHAGALDRPGSLKGGPYSHGAFPGAGQYGKLEISDDGGDVITVRLSGRTWDGQELTSLTVEVAA